MLSNYDLPRPGIEPVAPSWAGGFFTTEPPGKPCKRNFYMNQKTKSLCDSLCHESIGVSASVLVLPMSIQD